MEELIFLLLWESLECYKIDKNVLINKAIHELRNEMTRMNPARTSGHMLTYNETVSSFEQYVEPSLVAFKEVLYVG